MSSYRFCRSDDVPLLVRAHNTCYAGSGSGVGELTTDSFKSACRELDVWASSCMVASVDGEPVAVLLATKREHETLIWRVGVRPDHLRRGHGRHLLTSLSAKLAILGPPRLVAEVPDADSVACRFFEACGYGLESTLTDFVLAQPGEPGPQGADLISPVTVDDLVAADALSAPAVRSWEGSRETLIKRKDRLGGLAVASEARIEGWLLYENDPQARERRVVGFGAADSGRAEVWLSLLFRAYATADPRPLRVPGIAAEREGRWLVSWRFEPEARTRLYAAKATPG